MSSFTMVGLPSTGDEKRVSRAVRRQHELAARKIAKRDGNRPKKCFGKTEGCSPRDKACEFQFDMSQEGKLVSSGCTTAEAPGGKPWGSGSCEAFKDHLVVVCTCDNGDNCGGDKDAMQKTAIEEYYKMNPTTTTKLITTTSTGKTTDVSESGGGVSVWWLVGGGLAVAVVIGGAIYLICRFTTWFSFLKKKTVKEEEGTKDNTKAVTKNQEKEEHVSDDEAARILERIIELSSETDKVDTIVQNAIVSAKKVDTPPSAPTTKDTSMMTVLPIPKLEDTISFFERVVSDKIERIILVDFSDEVDVVNLLPDEQGVEPCVATGDVTRFCKEGSVTFTKKDKNTKAELKYDKEELVSQLQSLIRRKCTVNVTGSKTATVEFLSSYAYRKIILNFESCAILVNKCVSDEKRTVILIPRDGDCRGVSITLAARMIRDVRVGVKIGTDERLSEVLKEQPNVQEFDAAALRVTTAVTLCALRQRFPKTLPQQHTQAIDGYTTKILLTLHN